MTTLGRIVTLAAAALTLVAVAAAPAQAAAYRQLKATKDGTCVRTTASPADLRSRSCAVTPTSARDWQVIVIGEYNRHPVWELKNRNTGRCLARAGTTGLGTLTTQACVDSNNNYWEIFTVGAGSTKAIVLKSFGAFVFAGSHACLRYQGSYSAKNVRLAGCNVNDGLQRWRL